jgi:predicted RNase H-like HicB family nuclease|tara:strand:- start:356 stop:559 length:204 start_codon:yes stop_codon:yes gene_type:complete
MGFFKKQEAQTIEPQKNFTLKLKQDRNKNWICESARVQGDTIEQIKQRMDELIDIVIEKTTEINGDE